MTFYVENETQVTLPFDIQELVSLVGRAVLENEGCPFDVQVNVVLTDNAGIHEVNKLTRDIDRPTDVLSFPNLEFAQAGEFVIDQGCRADYFDPESGELLLGDIMISVDRVISQAKEYGHSQRREFAFLMTHSMLHLCGYDHMEQDEAKVMEAKQEEILNRLGITRD